MANDIVPGLGEPGFDRFLGGLDDDDIHAYGQLHPPAFLTPASWDGEMAVAPRRPELLGDAVAAWWKDLECWTEWLLITFRLSTRIPPCWPQHPALVEELMALWMVWQAGWLPGVDPGAPVAFLRELDWALSRIERLWRPACTATEHKPTPPQRTGAEGTPDLHPWWSNPTLSGGS